MTRKVLGSQAIYLCDGPYSIRHGVVFVPLEHDRVPDHWYVLLHGEEVRHFCDTDCLRTRLDDDYKAFMASELEELRKELRQMAND